MIYYFLMRKNVELKPSFSPDRAQRHICSNTEGPRWRRCRYKSVYSLLGAIRKLSHVNLSLSRAHAHTSLWDLIGSFQFTTELMAQSNYRHRQCLAHHWGAPDFQTATPEVHLSSITCLFCWQAPLLSTCYTKTLRGPLVFLHTRYTWIPFVPSCSNTEGHLNQCSQRRAVTWHEKQQWLTCITAFKMYSSEAKSLLWAKFIKVTCIYKDFHSSFSSIPIIHDPIMKLQM